MLVQNMQLLNILVFNFMLTKQENVIIVCTDFWSKLLSSKNIKFFHFID